MKIIMLFVLLSMIALNISGQTETSVFIPKGEAYVKLNIKSDGKSLNEIKKLLKYQTKLIKTYTDFYQMEGDIIAVGYKLFSEELVFVLTKGNITTLTKEKVDDYLINYKWEKVYDAYTIESELKDAINNKYPKVEYFAKTFQIKKYASDCTINVLKLGYLLKFKNNVLVSYSASDGLNKWAKMWKQDNYATYESYKMEAEKYWGDDEAAIINEINIQADAWSKTPDAWRNEYIKFHTSPEGNINFKMLLVAQYKEPISKDEFFIINHGRYELLDEYNAVGNYKRTTYKVNNTYFTFSENGILLNTYAASN